jgi:hypothetical protein
MIYQRPEECFDELKGYNLPTSRNESLLDANRPLTFEEQVNKVMKQIKADSEWSNSIKEKAERNGNTFEKQMKDDAIWVVKHKDK